jgi:hypothetical protein
MNDDDKSLFDRLKARGEEVFSQVTGELMQNERFMKAMQSAFEGKQKVDQAVGRVLKTMNVPTRSELKRAVARIEQLEEELEAVKTRLEPKPAGKARPRAAKPAARGRRGA